MVHDSEDRRYCPSRLPCITWFRSNATTTRELRPRRPSRCGWLSTLARAWIEE
jgi:hypothetical protein